MGYIYGLIPVLEALRAKRRRIEEIILAEGNRLSRLEELLALARKSNIPLRYYKRQYLDNLTKSAANHQGVIAIASEAKYTNFEDILVPATEKPLYVLLDNVEDPHNLGAIIRSAECAGAKAVIIPEHHSVGLTETVSKSSAGAIEYLPVVQVTNLVQTIDELKANNVWVIGVEAATKTNYTDWDFKVATAIVLGSEGKGIRRLVKEHCDALVSIPLLGKVTSLNVSVATAIVLYEAVRQRTNSTV
ncbi:MAG: 23S rRNA (guanosine(2251)-2'-O)-methyltransferase RlmB [Acidobacteria bacterium]|nr:23S rRNA (guanosine(2251)-2'-O)-methyltransferase RlmB [Acidobacteriota bacterium]